MNFFSNLTELSIKTIVPRFIETPKSRFTSLKIINVPAIIWKQQFSSTLPLIITNPLLIKKHENFPTLPLIKIFPPLIPVLLPSSADAKKSPAFPFTSIEPPSISEPR